MRRTRRLEVPRDGRAILAALLVARRAVVDVLSTTRIGGPVYRSAEHALAAIDGLGEAVSGEREVFLSPLPGPCERR